MSELDDRVYVQTRLPLAGEALARLADTVVALDGLQVVATPRQAKGRSLASEIEDYLRDRPRLRVRKSPVITLRKGLMIRPSLTVQSEARGEVLVQAGATSSRTQAFDHAFTTFALVDQVATVPLPQRLTILGGRSATWTPGRLRALAEVTFVGFWEHRSQIVSFLEGDTPNDPILVPPGIDIPMFPV